MAIKARLSAVMRRALARAENRNASNFMGRWKDAHQRGKVLCKDGKERSESAWLKTLPKELADQIRAIRLSG